MPDQSFEDIDAGRSFDWGRTSEDYDRFRPGPPDSFYRKLTALEIGLPGQRMLDLGTGTGLLARRFAAQGAIVEGIDVADGQIAMARVSAAREGLNARFQVAPAESIPFADGAFDVITANQCWGYFDTARVVPEVLRLLAPGGRLVVSYFSFLPRLDPVVRASEALVLQYNPDWTGADWDGVIPPVPGWSKDAFELVGLFVYDELIPFTIESWRGRMRALRGIAASLPEDEVRAFDRAHDALLRSSTREPFEIRHRIHAHIFAPAGGVPLLGDGSQSVR